MIALEVCQKAGIVDNQCCLPAQLYSMVPHEIHDLLYISVEINNYIHTSSSADDSKCNRDCLKWPGSAVYLYTILHY